MRSFSASAKAEICREFPQSGCCALAECFGILLFCNSFRNDSIKIITESSEFAALLPKLTIGLQITVEAFQKGFRIWI